MATVNLADSSAVGDTGTAQVVDTISKSDPATLSEVITMHKDIWGGINKSSDVWVPQIKS